MGGDIADAIAQSAQAWKAALARNVGIAERVVTHTPDPYLDAAMPMMAFATEGTWGDTAIRPRRLVVAVRLSRLARPATARTATAGRTA